MTLLGDPFINPSLTHNLHTLVVIQILKFCVLASGHHHALVLCDWGIPECFIKLSYTIFIYHWTSIMIVSLIFCSASKSFSFATRWECILLNQGSPNLVVLNCNINVCQQLIEMVLDYIIIMLAEYSLKV